MIFTEEEAKTKRCQESFGPPHHPQAIAYGVSATAQMSPSICIGSACMAWRWTLTFGGLPTKKGYCGKAGNPERTSK